MAKLFMLKTAGSNSSHQSDESTTNSMSAAKCLNPYGLFEFCRVRSALDGAAILHESGVLLREGI